MTWAAFFAAVLGLTAGFTPGAAAIDDRVNGRCADGRVWTTAPVAQDQMLGLLNQARAAAARPPLTRVEVLDRMAMAHAADMACRNYFDHVNPERQTVQDRLARVNPGSRFTWHRLAEVIGTSATPQLQIKRWLNSRPHRRAVLEEEHDRVGIGLVRLAGSRYGTYWAVDFAAEGR